MKITRKKLRKLIKEVYVQLYKQNPQGQMLPAFEKVPANLSKQFLERYMLQSYKQYHSELSAANPHVTGGIRLSKLQAKAFFFARADLLRYVHDILAINPKLRSDAPGSEMLRDKTRRSHLVFTTNDYEENYDQIDPRLLPKQSLERVIKTSQDDILGITKGVAMFDPSQNAAALDDYVNSIVDYEIESKEQTNPSMRNNIKSIDDPTEDIIEQAYSKY